MSMTTAKMVVAVFIFLTCVSFSFSKVVFKEQFDTDPFVQPSRWSKSSDSKYADQPVSYLPGPNPVSGYEDDMGLQLTQEMKNYGFGAKFSEILKTKNSDVVVQYEVKFVDTLSCGGAYVKLLRDDIDISDLKDSTPYTIMFGPDKCGQTNKVHFILQHLNPVTQKWEEKHAKDMPAIMTDRLSHLYTLVVRSDNSFEVFVDKESKKKGTLLSDMEPPVNPPAEIGE
jgi:calnexin